MSSMSSVEVLGSLAGSALVAAVWQGMALAAVVWICLRLVPWTTAALRFGLWIGVLLLVCILPFVESASFPARGSSLLRVDLRWSLALTAIWLAWSLARAVDLVWHGFRLRALSRDAVQVAPAAGVRTLLATSSRKTKLCTSARLDRPGVIGFFRPSILVPVWLYEQLTAPELEQIVLHELEHLRRGDDWLNLLQKMVLVIFPLNPVLHWIERRLCLERELACDEGVVRRTRAPRLYATCLAKLAEHGLDRRAASLALGILERQSELGRRVAGVLREPEALPARYRMAVAGTVAAALLGGSIELARCPRLISFGAAPMVAAAHFTETSPAAWISQANVRPVVYTDAAAAHFVNISLAQARKPVHRKVKAHRIARPAVLPQHAEIRREVSPTDVLAALPAKREDAVTAVPSTPAMITPTLVRYTLVRVDGGWLLLQL